MHLVESEVICSPCSAFTKHLQRIQKFKETVDLNYIYKSKLDKFDSKDCKDTDSKDLANRAISDKILKDRANELTLKPKHDRYQGGLASIVYISFLTRK